MWELAIEKDFDPTSIQEWMKKNWVKFKKKSKHSNTLK